MNTVAALQVDGLLNLSRQIDIRPFQRTSKVFRGLAFTNAIIAGNARPSSQVLDQLQIHY
jgi:hypothetical protein